MNQVILNALSPVVCFDVILSTVNEALTSFTIQLMMTPNQNNNYNIRFRQQLIVVDVLQQQPVTMTTTCKYVDNLSSSIHPSQSLSFFELKLAQAQGSLGSSGVAAITLAILLILSIALNATFIIVLVILSK